MNLDESIDAVPARDSRIVELDEALNVLAQMAPRTAKVVELRFFGGLGVEETAEVMRAWRTARAWLLRELSRT